MPSCKTTSSYIVHWAVDGSHSDSVASVFCGWNLIRAAQTATDLHTLTGRESAKKLLKSLLLDGVRKSYCFTETSRNAFRRKICKSRLSTSVFFFHFCCA
jgi:hypothetical protein